MNGPRTKALRFRPILAGMSLSAVILIDPLAGLAQTRSDPPGLKGSVDNDILKAREQELAALKAQMNGSAPKVNLSTPPAPVGDSGPVEMDPAEYAEVMRRGGPEALALRDRGVKFRR